MATLTQRKELILQHELIFANAIGSAVFEKPKVSFWMVLIPLLFLYFIYRMQRYKTGRMKFDEEFMSSRRRVMDAVMNALQDSGTPDLDEVVRGTGLPEPLQKPFGAWIQVLSEHYRDLLSVDGDSLASLVRGAYGTRTNYLLAMNRLTTVERVFYAALGPYMDAAEGASQIIGQIEAQSQRLRREAADAFFC